MSKPKAEGNQPSVEREKKQKDRSTAHLVRVRVRETRKNSFVYGAM